MPHSENYKHPKTAINGIMQYLSENRLWRLKSYQSYDSSRELNRILLGYFKHFGLDTKGIMRSKKMIAENQAAQRIRTSWDKFVEYTKTLEKI
jgi:hypothetical protein